MSALVVYRTPAAIARAYAARGYVSLQLEAHAEALARAKRMGTPRPESPGVRLPPGGQSPMPKTPAQIVNNVVAEDYALPLERMLSRGREPASVEARMSAMWLLKRVVPTMSMPAIGRRYDRDHTTILHDLKRIDEQIVQDGDFGARIRRLEVGVLALLEDARRAGMLIERAPRRRNEAASKKTAELDESPAGGGFLHTLEM